MEQAKCHEIPDFHKNQTERFFSIWTTGFEYSLAARARLSASGQLGRVRTDSGFLRSRASGTTLAFTRARSRQSKGVAYVPQSNVGRQPHGSHLPPARHLHVAHGVVVARARAARGRARRSQG